MRLALLIFLGCGPEESSAPLRRCVDFADAGISRGCHPGADLRPCVSPRPDDLTCWLPFPAE